jgi:Skp family chaperone for outer membrane proteins
MEERDSMSKRQKVDLPRGQLTLEQILERRQRLLDIEARELEAMRREQQRDRAEAEAGRRKRALEAAVESKTRGSMKLPKLVRGT